MALCANGDGGEGGGCGDDSEGGRGYGRSVCAGAVVLAVSLMSALRHRTLRYRLDFPTGTKGYLFFSPFFFSCKSINCLIIRNKSDICIINLIIA